MHEFLWTAIRRLHKTLHIKLTYCEQSPGFSAKFIHLNYTKSTFKLLWQSVSLSVSDQKTNILQISVRIQEPIRVCWDGFFNYRGKSFWFYFRFYYFFNFFTDFSLSSRGFSGWQFFSWQITSRRTGCYMFFCKNRHL